MGEKQSQATLIREAIDTAPNGEFTTRGVYEQVVAIMPMARLKTVSSVISVLHKKGKIYKVRRVDPTKKRGWVYAKKAEEDPYPPPAPLHKMPPTEPLDVQAEVTVNVESNLDYAATGKAISEYVRQVEGEVAKLRTENIDLKAAIKAANAEHGKQICDYKRQVETLNRRLTERNQMVGDHSKSPFKLAEMARYRK